MEYVPAILWPKYLERAFTNRTLAYYRDDILYTEDTKETLIHPDGLISTLFSLNLLLFVQSIVALSFLDDLIQAGHTIFCDEGGQPLAVRLKGPRNSTRWIVQASRWGQLTPVPGFLEDLRIFYTHMGVGTQTTPGGTGQALMRKIWREEYGHAWFQHRHQRPSGQACKDIRSNLVGGRSDAATDPHMIHESVWELDQHNAYAVACRRLPSGPTFRVFGRQTEEEYVTWLCHATITITQQLPLGCFPVREKSGKLCYPTLPGEYTGVWWREEIDTARQAGCLVKPGKGWAWAEWCTDLAKWEEMLSEKRRTAPNEAIAGWCKHAMVAGLGRFNLPDERYTLEPDMLSDDDTCTTIDEMAVGIWIHKRRDARPANMPHWYSYLMMTCRLSLYQKALPYAQAEQLLATNTDAVYIDAETDVDEYPDHAEKVGSGTWRKTQLHDVRFPKNRHIVSREKTRRPGKPRERAPNG